MGDPKPTTPHAERIKREREWMKTYGVNRADARKMMAEAANPSRVTNFLANEGRGFRPADPEKSATEAADKFAAESLKRPSVTEPAAPPEVKVTTAVTTLGGGSTAPAEEGQPGRRGRRGEAGADGADGTDATLPTGSAGDIMYHNGTTWVVLACPSAGTPNKVLRHNGTAPYWDTPSSC